MANARKANDDLNKAARRRTRRRAAAVCTLALLAAPGAFAQGATTLAESAAAPPAEEQAEAPEAIDRYRRDTPRETAENFLAAAEQEDWELAARYLDLRNLRGPARRLDGEELARQLYLVISRNVRLDLGGLSNDPEGAKGDGLPDYRDLAGTLQGRDGPVEMYLQRVPGEQEGEWVWKLSNASVSHLPELAAVYAYPGWVEAFRARFPGEFRLLGVEGWKWGLTLALLLAAWPVLWLVLFGLARLAVRPANPAYPAVRRMLTGPLLALLLVLLGHWLLNRLGLGLTGQKIASAYTLTTVLVTWLLFTFIDLLRTLRRARYEAAGRTDAAVLGRPLATTLKLIVLAVAIVFWLSNLGFNVTAMVAGLGIGGVALALAMQKPIEDLFGSVSLYSQRQVQTGEMLRYGNHIGVVEEIGLRTTQIRTLDNTVLSVPNSRLAYEDLENISRRERIIYKPRLRLRLDTRPEQLRAIVADIEAMLRENEKVWPDVQRVHFRAFGEYWLEVTVHAYILTTQFDEYLDISQRFNLQMLEVVHRHGAALAMPEGRLGGTRGD